MKAGQLGIQRTVTELGQMVRPGCPVVVIVGQTGKAIGGPVESVPPDQPGDTSPRQRARQQADENPRGGAHDQEHCDSRSSPEQTKHRSQQDRAELQGHGETSKPAFPPGR